MWIWVWIWIWVWVWLWIWVWVWMYMYLRVSMGSFHERAFHDSLYDRTLLNCQCQASQENLSYRSFSTDIWSLLSHERHGVWNGRQLNCLFNNLFSISRRKQPSCTLTVMSKGVCVCVHRRRVDYPAKASYAERFSMSWCPHDIGIIPSLLLRVSQAIYCPTQTLSTARNTICLQICSEIRH